MSKNTSPFEFVQHVPNAALSRENRSKIRRHAMRAVGAARREQHEADGAETTSSGARRRYPLQSRLLQPPVARTPIDLLVQDQGLSPMDLSALTSVHFGSRASAALQKQPDRLQGVLSCRQQSYLSFVPLHYGHVAALDDAFRSLVTAAHSKLIARDGQDDNKALVYYGRALGSLQSAVNDPDERRRPEVLCAVSMLALVEILNPSSSSMRLWDSHVVGSALLVQARGAQSFTSDFDFALLTGLFYPIATEALLSKKDCFFDDDAWAGTLMKATYPHETFTDRSPLGIALMQMMAKVPGLANRTDGVVAMFAASQGDSGAREQALLETTEAVQALRNRIIGWRRDFNTALIHAVSTTTTSSTISTTTNLDNQRTIEQTAQPNPSNTTTKLEKINGHYELLGISLVIHILVTRMLVCLSPPASGDGSTAGTTTSSAALLEDEAQALAAELRQVRDSVPTAAEYNNNNNNNNNGSSSSSPGNDRALFNLRQKALVAEAAIATRDDFRAAVARRAGRVVDLAVLRRYCVALGRKC